MLDYAIAKGEGGVYLRLSSDLVTNFVYPQGTPTQIHIVSASTMGADSLEKGISWQKNQSV
jgi:hypothetical protein